MKTLGNRVLLKKPTRALTDIQSMEFRKGTVIIPEKFLEPKVAEFEIVQIGQHKDVPPELKVGQHVLMDDRMGHAKAGEGLRIMSTRDILAIVEPAL